MLTFLYDPVAHTIWYANSTTHTSEVRLFSTLLLPNVWKKPNASWWPPKVIIMFTPYF